MKKKKKSTRIKIRSRLVRVARTEMTDIKKGTAKKLLKSNLNKRRLPRHLRRELRKKELSLAKRLHL